MRLMNAETLRLEEFSDEAERPPYAILSHFWGKNEIVFDPVAAALTGALLSESPASEKVRAGVARWPRLHLDRHVLHD